MWRRSEACTHHTVLEHEQNQPFQLERLTMGEENKKENRTSLVVQWFRICLPMQGMRV